MRYLDIVPGLLLSVLLLVHPVAGEDTPCTVRRDGRLYDLRPLQSNKDYHFKSPDGAAFSLNVCRALVDDTWNVKVPRPDEVGGTVRRAHGDFSLGSVNTTVDVRAGAPVLTYTGGSECTGDAKGARGATVVRFVCDRGFGGATGDGAGKGKPEFIAQVPQDDENACTFLIEWRTQYACPADEGWSFWSITLTIFLVLISLLALYILLGALYRRRTLHLRGIDQLPPLSTAHAADTFRFCRDALDDVWARRADPFDRYGSAWAGWDVRGGSGAAATATATAAAGRAAEAGTGAVRSGVRGAGGYGYEQVPAQREEVEALFGADDESDEEEEDEEDEDEDEDEGPRDEETGRKPPAPGPASAPLAATTVPGHAPPQGMDGSGVIRL